MLKRELASNGNSELQCKTKNICLAITFDNNIEFLYFVKNGTRSLLKKSCIWESGLMHKYGNPDRSSAGR